MKLGSLFDGSGGFPLAGTICGIEPVWSSEIEKYPLDVTAKRFPNVKQLGSVLDINGAAIEPVDIITFGSPCQDLSVAGKQKGIHDGERSSLFFEAIRIIKEMRERDRANGRSGINIKPRFAVWENVPGAFSSNGGADFAAVLEAFESVCEGDVVPVSMPEKGWKPAGCVVGDGWSVAWRVYDAQYWGVPQRRRRIYLVADFGSECAGEILFKRSGVPRDTEPSIKAWKDFANNVEGGAGGSCCAFHLQQDPISDETKSPCIGGQHQATVGVAAFMGGQGAKAGSIGYCDDGTTPTLKASSSGTNQAPDIVYSVDCRNDTLNEGISGTLQLKNNSLQSQNPILYTQQAFGQYEDTGVCSSCKQRDYKDATDLVVDTTQITSPANYSNPKPGDPRHPLAATAHVPLYIGREHVVRRLTPLECCRLQGFPDWWTDDTGGSDSSRYKMWGNGIALPCAVDVLWRVKNA